MGKYRSGRYNDSNVSPNAIRQNYCKPMRQKNKPPYERYRPFQSDRYGRHNRYQNNFKRWTRSPSPVIGSEEYMNKKIENMSALIMRQLMSPEENEPLLQDVVKPTDSEKPNIPSQELKRAQKHKTKSNKKCKTKEKTYDVEEIHNKIMNHISNLNEGRKKNLIYSSSSDYDGVIENMLKQKRLEISRALRNMCSGETETTESSEFINSIIPDIGIKIEELPRDFIEELTKTFDDAADTFVGKEVLEEHNAIDTEVTYQNISSPQPSPEEIVNIDLIKKESINEDISGTLLPKIEETEIDNKEQVEGDVDSKNENELVMVNCDCDNNLSSANDTDNSKQDHLSSLDNENSINVPKDIVKKESEDISIDTFLNKLFNKIPESLEEAVNRMFEIDQIIAQLTTYRQGLFKNFVKKSEDVENEKVITKSEDVNDTEDVTNQNNCQVNNTCDTNAYIVQGLTSEITHPLQIQELQEVQEKMLVLKIVGEQLISGSESGKIFFCDLNTGNYTLITQVAVTPITSLSLIKDRMAATSLYIGSLENHLKVYNLREHSIKKTIVIQDSAQCMEESWGYIFIGSPRGFLFRYSAKKEDIEYEDKIGMTSIQVIKATNEGARRVLLVTSGDSVVHIRDAISGLCLRTIAPLHASAVSMKCLIVAQSNLYCGTNNELLVFSFHDGKLIHNFKKNNTTGVNDMKILGQLLFVAGGSGMVNIYNLKSNQYLGSINGPGGSILAMEVSNNKIIVSTVSLKFGSIPIPKQILLYK